MAPNPHPQFLNTNIDSEPGIDHGVEPAYVGSDPDPSFLGSFTEEYRGSEPSYGGVDYEVIATAPYEKGNHEIDPAYVGSDPAPSSLCTLVEGEPGSSFMEEDQSFSYGGSSPDIYFAGPNPKYVREDPSYVGSEHDINFARPKVDPESSYVGADGAYVGADPVDFYPSYEKTSNKSISPGSKTSPYVNTPVGQGNIMIKNQEPAYENKAKSIPTDPLTRFNHDDTKKKATPHYEEITPRDRLSTDSGKEHHYATPKNRQPYYATPDKEHHYSEIDLQKRAESTSNPNSDLTSKPESNVHPVPKPRPRAESDIYSNRELEERAAKLEAANSKVGGAEVGFSGSRGGVLHDDDEDWKPEADVKPEFDLEYEEDHIYYEPVRFFMDVSY